MITLRLPLILALVALTTGCDPRHAQDIPPIPDDFIERGQFVEIHAQLQLLEAAHRQHMLKGDRDRARSRYRASILKQAGATDSAFNATYNWWYSQPEALPALLEEIQLQLDSLALKSRPSN